MSFGRLGALGRGFGGLGSSLGGSSTPGGSPYTMAAGLGSFVLTGETMTPLTDRILPSAQGSFALTGQDATLTYVPVVSYTGPGDILASAYAWYSPARAYSAAFAAGGTAIMDLVDQAGANPITINILSTGFADVSAITTWVTAHTVTTIKVAKLYDQSGNGRDVVQATLSNMPVLTLNSTPKGTLPAITSSASQVLQSAATYTQAQPITASAVYIRSTGTAQGGVIGPSSASVFLISAAGSANLAEIATPTSLTRAAADNTWHAVNTLASGASSAINVNGAETTGGAGTTGFAASNIRLCRAGAAELLGSIAEAGFWAATSNSTVRGDLSTNQHHATNGYNF